MELRAQCKALRSFRRRVKPLGRTSGGHPLFVVDSLKLALPRGARHFHRVLACSRCGAELVEWERAVSRPHDLEMQRRERLCESCSQLPPLLGVDDDPRAGTSSPSSELPDAGAESDRRRSDHDGWNVG